jgi:hypothetical protein
MGANDRTNVIPLVLPRPVAEELIHRLAREGQYVIEPVCVTKMRERKFTARQVMTTIEEGHINQGRSATSAAIGGAGCERESRDET